jgi:hypothetical protein
MNKNINLIEKLITRKRLLDEAAKRRTEKRRAKNKRTRKAKQQARRNK